MFRLIASQGRDAQDFARAVDCGKPVNAAVTAPSTLCHRLSQSMTFAGAPESAASLSSPWSCFAQAAAMASPVLDPYSVPGSLITRTGNLIARPVSALNSTGGAYLSRQMLKIIFSAEVYPFLHLS